MKTHKHSLKSTQPSQNAGGMERSDVGHDMNGTFRALGSLVHMQMMVGMQSDFDGWDAE